MKTRYTDLQTLIRDYLPLLKDGPRKTRVLIDDGGGARAELFYSGSVNGWRTGVAIALDNWNFAYMPFVEQPEVFTVYGGIF